MRTDLPATFFAIYTQQSERREAVMWLPRAAFEGMVRVTQEPVMLPETPGCRLTCHVTNLSDAPLTVAILYSRGVPMRQSAPIPQLLCRWTECEEFVMVSANIVGNGRCAVPQNEGYALGVVRNDAHVTFGQWETPGEGDELWTHFARSGTLSPRFASDRECILSPALAIASRFDLPPRGAKSVPFVWAWWLPGQPQNVQPFANVQQVALRLLQSCM
ncbi:MAG: GH116 family glycosyl-hydrolase [Abditibacteriales bacterium]|nr:GH116 family glycosyl-hydrolase [Abditibacteriales bacterium]MDW8368296.1 GH116 family glycosyl-hydrolase [Abditibacteriales bacterium]